MSGVWMMEYEHEIWFQLLKILAVDHSAPSSSSLRVVMVGFGMPISQCLRIFVIMDKYGVT